MEVLMIIFVAMALLIGLFSATLVGRDVIIEEKERRRKKASGVVEEQPAPQPAPAPQPVVAPAPAPQPVVEEPTAAQAEPAIDLNDESTVAFSKDSQNLDEKYLALEPQYKGYYDEIVRSAMAVEGSKRYKNASYEEYKVGTSRLVRIKIRRGIVVCELVIPNLAFKSYMNSNKVAMKQAPATIKVLDEQSLEAVKHSIVIAVQAIEEEKAFKKEQAKLRRKQNREAAKEAAAANAEQQ